MRLLDWPRVPRRTTEGAVITVVSIVYQWLPKPYFFEIKFERSKKGIFNKRWFSIQKKLNIHHYKCALFFKKSSASFFHFKNDIETFYTYIHFNRERFIITRFWWNILMTDFGDRFWRQISVTKVLIVFLYWWLYCNLPCLFNFCRHMITKDIKWECHQYSKTVANIRKLSSTLEYLTYDGNLDIFDELIKSRRWHTELKNIKAMGDICKWRLEISKSYE